MHKIDEAAVGDPAVKRTVRLGDRDLIPGDLWNLQTRLFGESNDAAVENA